MANTTNADSHRREFLRKAGATAAIAGFSTAGVGTAVAQDEGEETNGDPFEDYPFTLGVASGDPLPGSVVLWTRLAPEPLQGDGGMPDRDVPVQWRLLTTGGDSGSFGEESLVGDDDPFSDDFPFGDEESAEITSNDASSQQIQIIEGGSIRARPESAHSVHIDLSGLDSNTEYYYQFQAGSYQSPLGRTKTAPAADDDIKEFNFAFASCQNYPTGYYTSHQRLAEEDLDLAIHLGDYIYEGGGGSTLDRDHEPPRETESLDEYRIRHAQYKTDQNLQDAHAAFPWLVTWDDHELDNNWADEISQDDDPPDEFLARRADAFRAYFEHQPLSLSRMADGPDLPLYRRFTFGELAEFNVLDTRQYRDDQVDSSEEAKDPDRTILGNEQEDWLVEGLENSTAQWNVLANQVPVAARDTDPDPTERDFGGGDKWDGYRADRQTLLDVMAADAELNPIVVTGDVHRNYAYNLKADFSDPNSETVGTEYVGTSISSFGDGSGLTQYGPSIGEPWQRFFNDDRGYVRCTITPDQWRTDYRIVSTVEEPTASVSTIASFVTDAGDPGARLVSAQPRQESVEITGVQAETAGPGSQNITEEYATVRNTGDTALDASGFMLSFEGSQSQNYTFEEVTLEADETVTVRNGTGEDTQSTLYTGFEEGTSTTSTPETQTDDTAPDMNSNNPNVVLIANSEGIVLDERSYSPARNSNG